jgi:cytochrome c-type biogenesis protein CcmH
MTMPLLSSPLAADTNLPPSELANRQLPDPAQERAAVALMEELRCLVCQGQSIADSNAELAGDMRAMVRQRIAAGERPEQVRFWLIERYGNWVSYRPPVEPMTWPLWAAPIILLLAGAWQFRNRLTRRRR